MTSSHEQIDDPWRWSLALAIAFLALLLVRLGIPSIPVFDEVHYLPAARSWLAEADWINREHPMLGKLILARQIGWLGDNSFAWRLVPAILGAFTLYALMRALWFASGSRFASLAYGVLLATGFHLFVNSRIAMLDPYMLGFFALALWQLAAAVHEPETARWRLVLAGIGMGLALGSKWNVAVLLPLPGLAFLAARLMAGRKHPVTSDRGWPIPGISLLQAFLLLGVLPLAVYWLTFLPAHWALAGPLRPFGFVELHRSILNLQSSVTEPHPYQSTVWQWMLNIRPIWYLYEEVDGAQRGIIMLGNPVTMLLGLPALVWCAWAGLARRRWDALAVAVPYAVSLGFWVVANKPIQFYYHYLLPGCFLLAALALALDEVRLRWSKWAAVAVLVVSTIVFVDFYPILSAAPLRSEQAFVDWMWLESWQ